MLGENSSIDEEAFITPSRRLYLMEQGLQQVLDFVFQKSDATPQQIHQLLTELTIHYEAQQDLFDPKERETMSLLAKISVFNRGCLVIYAIEALALVRNKLNTQNKDQQIDIVEFYQGLFTKLIELLNNFNQNPTIINLLPILDLLALYMHKNYPNEFSQQSKQPYAMLKSLHEDLKKHLALILNRGFCNLITHTVPRMEAYRRSFEKFFRDSKMFITRSGQN